MRQAIQTKYLPPKGRRGARIKAWTVDHQVTAVWDPALATDCNHARAVLAYCKHLGVDPNLRVGGSVSPDVRVWVYMGASERCAVDIAGLDEPMKW